MTLTDFSSIDNQNYSNQLNEYVSNLNTVNDNLSIAKQKAREKVDQFNSALRDPLNLVGAPLTAKGVGATIKKVKANFNRQLGEKTDEMIEKAKQVASDTIQKGRQAFEGALPQNPFKETGQLPATITKGDLSETNLDQAIDQIKNPPRIPDEFDPSRIPEGAQGRVQLSEPKVPEIGSINPEGEISQAVESQFSSNIQGATETAKSAVENTVSQVTKGGEDALKGAKDALNVAEGVDASEGFLNPISDLATAGLGIGLSLAGLFAGKHVHTPPPPKPLQFSFQAGSQ